MKKYVFYNSTYDGNLKSFYEIISPTKDHIKIYWLLDSPRDVSRFPKDINVLVRGESKADSIIESASFLFEDKFHMSYPKSLKKTTPIINLWHGVGLKNIELNNPVEGILAARVMKRYILSSQVYKNQTYFVSTSTHMTEHFEKSTILPHNNFIEVGMPRLDPSNKVSVKLSDKETILWAPTFRDTGDFETILPSDKVGSLLKTLSDNNLFMIFSPHPNMRNDDKFKLFFKLAKKSDNIKILNENEDIYDYLVDIKYSIVDYSSIFYDLVYLGFDKFIRYIPDYETYSHTQVEFKSSYFSDTYGVIIRSIDELIKSLGTVLQSDLSNSQRRKLIIEKYFNRQAPDATKLITEKISHLKALQSQDVCGLYSFNANDVVLKNINNLMINNKVIILHFSINEQRLNIEHVSEYFVQSNETINDFYKRIFYIELKKYNFDYWRHSGSQKIEDELIPRKFGIQTNNYVSKLNQTKRMSLLQIVLPKRIGIYKDDLIFETRLSNTPKLLRIVFDWKINILKWILGRNHP